MFSRHQSTKASNQSKSLTKASKPPNQKNLLLVEVPRAESLVVECVGAILARVAEERVKVGGLEGVLPALRGPFVTQQANEGRALDESGDRDGAAQAVGKRVAVGRPRTPSRATVAISSRPSEASPAPLLIIQVGGGWVC